MHFFSCNFVGLLSSFADLAWVPYVAAFSWWVSWELRTTVMAG